MKGLTPYLFFTGKCREALGFYQKALGGGELTLMTYGDAQGDGCPIGAQDRIIHGALKRGDQLVLASDAPDDDLQIGNNVQISMSCESAAEVDRVFAALSDGGDPMLKDRYGFHWMLNFEYPKK